MALRIVVGFATSGRETMLRETLGELSRQSRPPDGLIVCATSPIDLDLVPGARVLVSPASLPRQRNAIADAASDADLLVFFDDDFVPAPDYLAAVERHMEADIRIVVATGLVLADGIGGPGLRMEDAREVLRTRSRAAGGLRPAFAAYGCNMAVRLAPMREHDIRFDERLPLYGWQEDVDFSRRLGVFGHVVQIDAAQGVHLGVKTGRGSGTRLGYSQVANPIYLWGKRSGYPLSRALSHIARNVAMNLARAPRPETYVDRRGRLKGNVLALLDLVAGRIAPERILDL